MKNIIYLLGLLFFTFINFSCDEYGKFTYTKSATVPLEYNINIDGAINAQKNVSEYDLYKPFDIPSNAKLIAVTVKSISVKVEDLPGTDAEFIDLSVEAETYDGPFLLDEYKLVETETIEKAPVSFTVLNNLLNEKGMTKFKAYLQKVLDPVNSGGHTSATFKLKGKAYSAISSGSQINANITIYLSLSVTYSVCEKVGLNVVGDDCD